MYFSLYTADEWFGKDKQSLGFDFPNLPYIIDGDKKLTQSRTLATYIAKKYKLAGASGDEEIKVSNAYNAIADVREALIKLANGDDFEEKKGEFIDNKAPAKLKDFEKVLAKGTWVAGTSTPSYADFALLDLLEQLYLLSSSFETKFPKLKAFAAKVNSLPQIAKYKKNKEESKAYIDTPFYGPSAKFGAVRG